MPEATALVTYTPSHHLQNLLNHLSYSGHIQSSLSQPTHSPPPYSQTPSFILCNSSSPTSSQIIHRQPRLHLCLTCRLERPYPHHQVSTVARTLQASVEDSPLQNSVGRRAPGKSSLVGLGSACDYDGCAILHCSPFGRSSCDRQTDTHIYFLF